MLDPYIILGIIGSISSIVGVAISSPNLKSRVIHGIYGFTIVLIAGTTISYTKEIQAKLEDANSKVAISKEELNQLKSIQIQAQSILDSTTYTYTSDIGKNRGFILAAFTFLETYKVRFPEGYEIAKKLVINGLRITESAGSVGSENYYNEQKRMEDGASAMRQLLKGIASPIQKTNKA